MKRLCPSRPVRLAVIAGSLVIAAAVVTPSIACAQFGLPGLPQVVYDPTAVGKLVSQISQMSQAIATARSQLQAQVANMTKLANPPWRTINIAMTQIDALTRQGRALSYAVTNLDHEFRSTFPGWSLSASLAADMRTQNERTLATLRGAMNATSATSAQLPVSSATLTAIKGRMSTIASAQQGLELNGVIGIENAEELTLLRQQLAAQHTAELVVYSQQVNHALQAAAYQQAYDASAQVQKPTPPRRNIAGWWF